MRFPRLRAVAAAAAAVTLVLAGCSPPSHDNDRGPAATATSAADLGGLDGLIAKAKAEGELNVIALPTRWANYGEIKALFEETYGITVKDEEMVPENLDSLDALHAFLMRKRAA